MKIVAFARVKTHTVSLKFKPADTTGTSKLVLFRPRNNDTADILMVNEHKQSLSFKTNCQVKNKCCYSSAQVPQSNASKSQYSHLAAQTKMKMRCEKYKTWCSLERAWSATCHRFREAPSFTCGRVCSKADMLKGHNNVIAVVYFAIFQKST